MGKTEPDNDLIDAHEAAKILKVTTGTLNNWRCMGVGPAYTKIGTGPRGNVRYSRETVKTFAKSMRRKLSRK